MDMKEAKTTCGHLMNNSDYLKPFKKIETVKMLKMNDGSKNVGDDYEKIPECKLMYDHK